MSGVDRHRADHEQKGAGPGVTPKPAALTPAADGIVAMQAAAGNRATASLLRQHAGRYSVVQRDPTAVEAELKKRFDDPNDPRLLIRRDALRDQMGRLNEKDSADLVIRLFQAFGNNVSTDGFQTLSADTRYELLSTLFGRLGHLGAEMLTEPLTSSTDSIGYQARFRQLVPDAQRRRKLLTVLSGQFATAHKQTPANRKLWVNWNESNFRKSGGFSADNKAQQAALKLGFSQLGVQPDPRSGNNVMELRGDVVGHVPGTTYDIKQTIEMRSWNLIGRSWIMVGTKSGDDDTHGNSDEDLTPDGAHPHVYLYDGPGVPPDMDFDPNASAYAYRATFVTWVIAKTPGSGKWERVSDDFEWHSSSTMKKVNGKWVRDRAGLNVIDVGPQQDWAPDL